SSSAVTVATLKALSELFNTGLKNDEIFEIARKVELDVQGRGSGIDPFISTFGGSWIFPKKIKVDLSLDLFVIKLWERATKEMVEKVGMLREKYGDVFESIFDAIDKITLRSLNCKLDELEDLIRINQSLLRAIGVSSPEIDEIVAKLEKSGFIVKITGAGGGGSIFGIYRGRKPEGSFLVKTNAEGVRIEDS
ncbi:MAG: mevalonate kinase, partial [Archaeoglobaceae archaeon]